jgi:chromosome segregation ATPase
MTSEPNTAEMLAFPSRPEDRLRRALRKLEAALRDQGVAVSEFRADLKTLSSSVVGLDMSMQEFRGRLAEAAGAANQANDAARRLEARADTLLRQQT